MFGNLLAVLLTLSGIIYLLIKWTLRYWERNGVPSLKASFPFGNMANPKKTGKNFSLMLEPLYHKLKSQGHKYAGVYMFLSPQYMPIHPEHIKSVMTKDFNSFVDRGIFFNEEKDPLSAHLFAIEGDHWKHLRGKLSPTFTSGKMKSMFQTLIECGVPLQKELEKVTSNKVSFDIKEMFACYTTDVIGSCAFGIDCDSFVTPNSPFRFYCNRSLKPTTVENIKLIFAIMIPKLAKFLNLSINPPDVNDFFINLVKDTVEYRKKHNIHRNDFMQILMNLQDDVESLSLEQMAAQAFIFFLGGFETSSTTMSFALYELSQNQEIQEKLRTEIIEMLNENNGTITYDAIMNMTYMNQVIDETLRKYPPVPALNRIATRDYVIPDTDIVITKGTRVLVPVYALHHDAEYFKDPEVFDPERFNKKNKTKIDTYTYLPFGDGPRGCIGTRFGQMQTKVGLATVLKNYRFTKSSKCNGIRWDYLSFLLSSAGPIFLDAEKI